MVGIVGVMTMMIRYVNVSIQHTIYNWPYAATKDIQQPRKCAVSLSRSSTTGWCVC